MDLYQTTGNIYNKIRWYKPSAGVSSAYTNLWRTVGYPGSGRRAPYASGGTDYICTNNTVGAMPISFSGYSTPVRIARAEFSTSVLGGLVLYDKLWHVGGIPFNTTVPTTITGSELPPRDIYGTSSGYGLEIWGDFQTAAVAVTSDWFVTYVDATGLLCEAKYAKTTAPAIQTMVPFNMQSGNGVSGIVSFRCSATGGALDSLALVVLRRIVDIPVKMANQPVVMDPLALGFPVLYSGTCLVGMTFGAAAGVMMGSIHFTEGT